MRAAIYARYSSENQRPESIEDQVGACRRLAAERGFVILEDQIYSDQAKSGARRDREGLAALIEAASSGVFDVVLVDDLSRLARDNYLMLSVLAELHFEKVRVVSVADGLDSDDEEATLGIQIRGIFNELQLRDLKKKTLRGQIGQKQRGFSVGERTFGYRSVPVGEMRMDKNGRPRPGGYRMEIDPREAAVVLRIFKAYGDGMPMTKIVKVLNEEGVPGRFRASKGWSPATVSRILDNEKYMGRWVWNKTESRRDPRTGRRRKFEKPESEWLVTEDESLRIAPQNLWEAVRARRKEVRKTWPGGNKRGFSADQGSRQAHFPTHLLSGTMRCGVCGGAVGQVSGKSGGYYGCFGAQRRSCENKLLVRRTLAEEKIVDAVRKVIAEPENVRYVLERVEAEVANLRSDLPETVKLKQAELDSEQRRLSNFIDFVGEGRGSQALAKALVESERRVESLTEEVDALNASCEKVFRAPPVEWIADRLANVGDVLKKRTGRSALVLREFLGTVTLTPTPADIGRPFYRAATSIDTVALVESDGATGGGEADGSNSLRSWRWRDSNPRPPGHRQEHLRAQPPGAISTTHPLTAPGAGPAQLKFPCNRVPSGLVQVSP